MQLMNVTEIKPIDIILPLKVEKYYDNDNNDNNEDDDNDDDKKKTILTVPCNETRLLLGL